MARSHDAPPPHVVVVSSRPRGDVADPRPGRPPHFREPELRRGPLLLARARRHWVALVPPLLGSALLSGAALGLLAATPALHTPLALALATLALCVALGFTLLLPLASWHVFRMDIFDDRIIVHELRGLLARAEQHPSGYTAVICERWPWDYLLRTGTITLHGAAGRRSFRLVTPVGWVRWITTERGSR
jgi:hypothetical protein